MAIPSSKTEHLKTQAHELIKQYVTYDAYDRPEYVYTAPITAITGTSCSVVRYSYDGVSNRVVYMKEYAETWDTSWETF